MNKSALKDYTNTVYNNNGNNRVNFADRLAETRKRLQKKVTQVQKK